MHRDRDGRQDFLAFIYISFHANEYNEHWILYTPAWIGLVETGVRQNFWVLAA